MLMTDWRMSETWEDLRTEEGGARVQVQGERRHR